MVVLERSTARGAGGPLLISASLGPNRIVFSRLQTGNRRFRASVFLTTLPDRSSAVSRWVASCS